jgi:hypothetical protein
MNNSLSRTFVAIATFFTLSLAVGCTKQKDADPLYIISGPATTLAAAPGVNTAAIGSISGIYNPVTHKIAYNITWENLSSEAVSSFFYQSSDDQPSDSLIFYLPITEAGKKGVVAGHLFLNEKQAKALVEQQWNFAICSANHVNGELRGKITVVKP